MSEVFSVAACLGQLILILTILRVLQRSSLALPLFLLSAVQFGWNLAALAHRTSGHSAWHWLDLSLSPLAPATLLHVVLAFVGRARERRKLLVAAYAIFGAHGLASASAFVCDAGRAWVAAAAWSPLLLATSLPVVASCAQQLLDHLRRTRDHEERVRTLLLFLAATLGAFFSTTELWNDVGVNVPRLGPLGTLAAALLLFTATARFRLLGDDVRTSLVLLSMALSLLTTILGLAFSAGAGLLVVVLNTLVAVALLVWLVLSLLHQQALERARVNQLVLLGRFTAQLAHDLKNPLATIKGGIQYLQVERKRGGKLLELDSYLALLLNQVDRVTSALAGYQRMARLELHLSSSCLNETIQQAAEGVVARKHPLTRLDFELDASRPTSNVDVALFVAMLQNLLSNAFDATRAGSVDVRSGRSPDGGVEITISDTGVGMDARALERAFDDFFTTKSCGSGLGLGFARRVARAHGGTLALSSELGRGTVASVRLPASILVGAGATLEL